MSAHIVIVNRLIKITGTVVKTLSYVFYVLFPKTRFTLPAYSAPLINSNTNTQIPRVIWQTNYTDQVTLPVYVNYLFNRIMSPTWSYRYVSNYALHEYLKTHSSPQEFAAFEQLTDGAAQADFWRVLVLLREGGVYMDIDAHVVWPMSWMIKPDYAELFLLNKKQYYTNYFIAARPNNQHLRKTLDLIVDNIENKRIDGGVYNMTGPRTLSMAIGNQSVNHRFYRITCNQGTFTNEYFQYLDKPRGKWP